MASSFSKASPGSSRPSAIATVSCSASWWYIGTGELRSIRRSTIEADMRKG